MADARFTRVEPGALQDIWKYLTPHVDSLLNVSSGEYSARDVLDGILTGQFQCWLAWSKDQIEGFAVTNFVDYPRMRKLVVRGAAGTNADAYLPIAMEEMKAFARDNGCQEIEIRGRKGWHRKLPDYEWAQVVLRMKL